MSKSFFSEDMMKEQSSKGGLSLATIYTTLYQLPNKAHYCHHNTSSYAAHKATDFAYEKITELNDDIVEQLVGYTGVRPNKVALQPLAGYTENMNKELAQNICDFGEALEEWAEANDYCNIENLAQEYSGVGAKLKYLLSLQ